MWNPVQDTTPIHTWLHPWLPPLGNRLEIVYPTIRNKLATALANWHPTDRYDTPHQHGTSFHFLLKNMVALIQYIWINSGIVVYLIVL